MILLTATMNKQTSTKKKTRKSTFSRNTALFFWPRSITANLQSDGIDSSSHLLAKRMTRPDANNVLKSPLVLNLHQLILGTSQLNTPRRKLVPASSLSAYSPYLF